MANTIRGKIEAIEPIQTIPSKTPGREPFQTRRVLLDATRFDGLTGQRSFENHVIIDFDGKNVGVPDQFKVNDVVEISFDLTGNKYTNKDGATNYFTKARGYKIEGIERQRSVPQAPQQTYQPQSYQSQWPQAAPAGNYNNPNDDRPF